MIAFLSLSNRQRMTCWWPEEAARWRGVWVSWMGIRKQSYVLCKMLKQIHFEGYLRLLASFPGSPPSTHVWPLTSQESKNDSCAVKGYARALGGEAGNKAMRIFGGKCTGISNLLYMQPTLNSVSINYHWPDLEYQSWHDCPVGHEWPQSVLAVSVVQRGGSTDVEGVRQYNNIIAHFTPMRFPSAWHIV